MGNCLSESHKDTPENVERNRSITKQLRKEGADEALVQKLLLLGTGESGKSTIFKQLRMLHQQGFDESERRHYSYVVHANIVDGISALVDAVLDSDQLSSKANMSPASGPMRDPSSTSRPQPMEQPAVAGFTDLRQGSYQSAVHHFTRAIASASADTNANANGGVGTGGVSVCVLYLARAAAQAALRHFSATLTDSNSAHDLEPNNFMVHLMKGVALAGLEQYESSVTSLHQAIDLSSSPSSSLSSSSSASPAMHQQHVDEIASFLQRVDKVRIQTKDMPEGWEELQDDEGTYYHNSITLNTTRIRPTHPNILPPTLEVSKLESMFPSLMELKAYFASRSDSLDTVRGDRQQDMEEMKSLWVSTIEDCRLRMKQNPGSPFLTPLLGSRLAQIWNHRMTQQTFMNRNYLRLLNVMDSISTFMDNIERISSLAFQATDEDIVLARVRTTGISEMSFVFRKVQFKVIDVGGQRSERRKWLPLFQGIEAVLFVVAINEYDQVLLEDTGTNRLIEALELFKVICSTQWLVNTPIILFMNKRDLFAEKIRRVDLSVMFPDYKGGRSFDEGCRFLMSKFVSCNVVPRDIFVHITCATDRNNIRFVFEAVQDIVVQRNVRNAGF